RRGEPGPAAGGKGRARRHVLADARTVREARQVSVDGHDAAGVLELDHGAVAAAASGEADAPLTRGAHRGADGRGVVDALVGADTVQERVPAGRGEVGAHTREL